MRNHLDGIDTLRGLAVSMVVIYHFFVLLNLNNIVTPFTHTFGLLGVSIFFIISGYLIYSSIDNNIKKRGKKEGLKNYFLHRLFRILPAYYFNLFVVLLISSFIIEAQYLYSHQFMNQFLSHLSLTSYFAYKSVGLGINGAYWTLNIEMLWYIIAPIFILYIKDIRILIFIIFSSLIYLLALDKGVLDEIFNINSQMPSYKLQLFYINSQLMGQINYFIIGILIYKYSIKSPFKNPFVSMILAISILLVFIGISKYYGITESFLLLHIFIIIATSTIFILIYQKKIPKINILNWLGKISYSIYLWHMPILFIMNHTNILLYLSLTKVVILFTILLLSISSLSYYFIEERLMVKSNKEKSQRESD